VTEIVNLSSEKADRRIDRTTKFGNPFRLEKDGGKYSRAESIQKYREWFYNRIQEDPEFRKEVEDLKGLRLGCWCKPKDCHGDIIKEYLDEEVSNQE